MDKTSWSGNLETMQYFATINLPFESDSENSSISSRYATSIEDEERMKKPNTKESIEEYWLSDDIIDPSQVHLPSPSLNSPAFKKSNESNHQTSSNSHKKNNLGMLITYNSNEKSNQKQKSSDEIIPDSGVKEKQQQLQPQQQQQKRFNIRNGLILGRSNRKKNDQESKCSKEDQSIDFKQNKNKHLQLIVSKCRCEFYIIDFDDKIPDEYDSTTKLFTKLLSNSQNAQIDLNATFNEPVDCFSLIHYDLNLCTNSQQHKLIMDIVSQLVFYFRPRRKQVIDKQKSIKFNLQLSMGDLDSLKQHIQFKQAEAKELLCKIRAMERKLYHLREKIEAEIVEFGLKYGNNVVNNEIYQIQELKLENNSMEKEYKEFKRLLNELSDELNISISCYKELMLEKRANNLSNTPQFVQHVLKNQNSSNEQSLPPKHVGQSSDLSLSASYSFISKLINDGLERQFKEPKKLDLDQQAQQSILNNEIGKRYEILFKHTQWTLNDFNGQTECAKFLMKNFLYTKVTNQQEMDCVEHTLEVCIWFLLI